MSKRKPSLPIKLSLTNSDEESVKKNLGEFRAGESDFDDDNGVFEEDTATELNSETEDTDSPQLSGSNPTENKRSPQQLGTDKASSAMLNSLSQQAMKRKHKKFRPSESEENVENFTNNMNNGSNTNLSSLMSLAMGNSQSAYDLFASMGNGQFLSTLARFASANNHQDQQPAALSKEPNQQTKNNNGLFKRRKRSELEEDEDAEPKDEYSDLKATDQTANLLAAISNLQQPQSTANSNEQLPLAQMVSQLTGGRRAPSDSEAKQESDRKLFEMLKQFNELKEKLMMNQPAEVPNGNSLANGSAFNNLQLDIVSASFLRSSVGIE